MSVVLLCHLVEALVITGLFLQLRFNSNVFVPNPVKDRVSRELVVIANDRHPSDLTRFHSPLGAELALVGSIIRLIGDIIIMNRQWSINNVTKSRFFIELDERNGESDGYQVQDDGVQLQIVKQNTKHVHDHRIL